MRRQAVLALSPKPLVVEPLDGVVERRQLVAATIWHLQRVKDGLGPVSAQGDRVVGVLDQPKLDRVGDGPSSYGSFGARLVRRRHPQGLRHERRCSLVERATLAGDLEHDLHSTEPSSPSGGVMLQALVRWSSKTAAVRVSTAQPAGPLKAHLRSRDTESGSRE